MYAVITGHENIYVKNFLQNRGRTVGEVSLCLSPQDASTYMQYDLPGSLIRFCVSDRFKVKIQIDL